jgi:hypothetical protein
MATWSPLRGCICAFAVLHSMVKDNDRKTRIRRIIDLLMINIFRLGKFINREAKIGIFNMNSS